MTATRICAYTRLHPLTRLSGKVYGFSFIPLVRDQDYFGILEAMWRLGTGFVNLEHDNLAYGICELERCPELWCVRPYTYGDRRLAQNLGLARFSADLTRAYPDLWDDVAKAGGLWGQLDGPLASLLLGLGHTAHQHQSTWHAK